MVMGKFGSNNTYAKNVYESKSHFKVFSPYVDVIGIVDRQCF